MVQSEQLGKDIELNGTDITTFLVWVRGQAVLSGEIAPGTGTRQFRTLPHALK